MKKKSIPSIRKIVQSVFKEKPITDPEPKTFPLEPKGNFCTHGDTFSVKGFDGFNCRDCGFYIEPSPVPLLSSLGKEEPHTATEYNPKLTPIPKISDKYNFLELPRAIFDIYGENLLVLNIGEADKKKLLVFSKLLSKYDIKSISIYNTNYLFMFEKK